MSGLLLVFFQGILLLPSKAIGSKRMQNRMSLTIGPIPISSCPNNWDRNWEQPQSCSSPLITLFIIAAIKITIMQIITEELNRENRLMRSMVPHRSSKREKRSAMAGIRNEGRIWYSAMTRPKNFRSESFSNPDMMKKAPSKSLRVVINGGRTSKISWLIWASAHRA